MENTQMKGGNGRMKKTLGNIVKAIIATPILGLIGYGCYSTILPTPASLMILSDAQKEISRRPSPTVDYSFGSEFGAERHILDTDGNGTADAIGFAGIADWYSEDWKGPKAGDARLRTPEIRET